MRKPRKNYSEMRKAQSDSAYDKMIKYHNSYSKKNYQKITIVMKRNGDNDIIEYLNSLPISTTQYFKNLIRKDMEENK